MKYLLLSVSYLLMISVSTPGQLPLTMNAKTRGLRIRQEAIANPFNEDKLKALMAVLPKDENLYVVEGDLLMTEQELRAYVVVKSQSERPADSSGELIVNVHNGQRDFYKDPSQRNLTYAIDRQTFQDEQSYKLVVENMSVATKDWQAACPECKVEFTHAAKSDLVASTEKVNFVVRFKDVGGAYIAAAFFPHDGPVRRYLNIDPSYFKTSFDKAGVLRHELGHVLGYRHEHTRGVPDCYYEDNNWQPLTEYDPKSVMHYFCGGGGTFSLSLTDLDKTGHRKLYQLTGATNIDGPTRNVRVRFDGSDLSKDVPMVLDKLTKLGLIEAKPYTVKATGEKLSSIYSANLQLPIISPAMLSYANSLNKEPLSRKRLQIGQEVLYPDVNFKAYQRFLVLNPANEKDSKTYGDIKNSWPASLVTEKKGPDSVTLVLKSYEMNLKFDSAEKETKARSALRTLKTTSGAKYVVLTAPKSSYKAAGLYSLSGNRFLEPFSFSAVPNSVSPVSPPVSSPTPVKQTAEEFFNLVLNNSGQIDAGLEGDLSLLLGELEDLQFPSMCTTNCPEVILMDTAVLLHPDIANAIKAGGSGVAGVPPINAATNKQVIRIEGSGEGILPFQHGTYMAGIIASQLNGFGLIGVNPKAEIISFDWQLVREDSDSTVVGDFIVNRQTESVNDSRKMQIFVFATEWKFRDEFQNRPEMRFDNSTQDEPDPWRSLAKQIKDSRPLIITAAGHAQAPSTTPKALNRLALEGPRNLGDLESVIVVTAYQPVEGNRPQIWPLANFVNDQDNEKIIHVAAPGLRVLSTVPNTGSGEGAPYGRGSGTSQATALVAGVVSAMVSAWPNYYVPEAPFKVKTRLQVTSNPFLQRADAGKLAAGMIDFNLAMHDPTKNWFRAQGQANVTSATDFNWLVDRIDATDLNGNQVSIETKKIYRIVASENHWYIYAATSPTKLGEIKKYGPLRRDTPQLTSLRLFELKESGGQLRQYLFGEVADLLLSSPRRRI